MRNLLKDIYAAFGWKTRIAAPLIGRFAYWSLLKEQANLASGRTYEPVTLYEKNAAALAFSRRMPAHAKAPVRKAAWVSGNPAPVSGQSG
jgi:hypothetical protein